MTKPANVLPALDRDMSTASDEQLLRVVGLIDTLDRRGPVDRLLDPVRDRLALLRPPRPISLGRVLILPFEDLLVAEHEVWPGRRCFSRAHIAGLIGHVTARLPGATLAELRRQAEGHSMISAEVVREIGATLWPAAAAMLAGAAGGRKAPALEGALAAPEATRRVAGVAPLLALAPTLVPTVWQLPPRPMGALVRPALDQLLDVLRAASKLGQEALFSLLELLLARAASPLVVLEPLRGADIGLPARERDAVLGQLVRRRIVDMRETAARLGAPAAQGTGRPSTAPLLRLVADLDALDGKWPVSIVDKGALAEVRKTVSAYVDTGIETAVKHEILTRFDVLGRPGGADDDSIERLEETARHTRRLGIAGARLGLAATPESLLSPFIEPFREAVRARGEATPAASADAAPPGLLDQVRIVEILFGADVAMELYAEQRRRNATG
jgi:hypothetical protein